MQPFTPKHARSSYDPLHEPVDKVRNRMTHSYRDIMARWERMKLNEAAIMSESLIKQYTPEQYEAFAQALEELDRQHPVVGDNHRARKQRSNRRRAASLARDHWLVRAIAAAVYGNIPKEQLHAIRALIFG
jgi:hypothetical protein